MSSAVLLALCLAVGFGQPGIAAGATETQAARGLTRIPATFTIADFDGDQKPDLVSIETETSRTPSAIRYSIRFRLTLGNSQSFGVDAPVGGLQLATRDVNGDSIPDILVSTRWQHQEVAVLLNDGHGNFKLADPSAFPETRSQDDRGLDSAAGPGWRSLAIVKTDRPMGDLGTTTGLDNEAVTPGRPSNHSRSKASASLIFPWSGRAPPAGVFPL